jgi:hypothetical protein
VGQGFEKEDVKKHKIKRVYTDGPNSRYYNIDEYDTSGNLITSSKAYDGKPPFVTAELQYSSGKLIEKRKYESYSPDRLEIIQYSYNDKGLLTREEDTIICPRCKIPKRITEYEYNDNGRVLLEKYKSGEFNTQQKYYYNGNGLLIKIDASTDSFKNKSHTRYYFYDDMKKLIKDSVYNFTSKRSLRTYYKYYENGRLKETRNMGGKTMYYQTTLLYNGGLLDRIISKQKGHGSKKYYTTETFFNFERY